MAVKEAALQCYTDEDNRYSLGSAARGLGAYRGSMYGEATFAEAFLIASYRSDSRLSQLINTHPDTPGTEG